MSACSRGRLPSPHGWILNWGWRVDIRSFVGSEAHEAELRQAHADEEKLAARLGPPTG